MLQIGEVEVEVVEWGEAEPQRLAFRFDAGAQGDIAVAVFEAGIERGTVGVVGGIAARATGDDGSGLATGQGQGIGQAYQQRGLDAVGHVGIPENRRGGQVAEIGCQGDAGSELEARPEVEAEAIGAYRGDLAVDGLGAQAQGQARAKAAAARKVKGVIGALLGRGDQWAVVGADGTAWVFEFGEVDIADADADQAQRHTVQALARAG